VPAAGGRSELRSDRADDVLGVNVEGGLGGVVHQVDAEVIRADLAQFLEALHVALTRAEQAEPVDDLVRHEG